MHIISSWGLNTIQYRINVKFRRNPPICIRNNQRSDKLGFLTISFPRHNQFTFFRQCLNCMWRRSPFRLKNHSYILTRRFISIFAHNITVKPTLSFLSPHTFPLRQLSRKAREGLTTWRLSCRKKDSMHNFIKTQGSASHCVIGKTYLKMKTEREFAF